MRISFISHEFPPLGGGAATALEALSSALVELGHAVQVVTIAHGAERVETLDGRECVFLGAGRKRVLAPTAAELIRSVLALRYRSAPHIKTFGPDVVVAFFAVPAGLAGVAVNQTLGIPLVVSLRGSDVPGFSAKRWGLFKVFRDSMFRRVISHSQLVLANGKHLTALARKATPAYVDRIHDFPNGVDSHRFCPTERPQDNELKLLYVGQLIPRKRVAILISMMGNDSLKANCHLTIVGDGPSRAALSEMAARAGLTDHITFAGLKSREELPAIYQAHDILLLPSRAEGRSNVVMEAMASGLAVIGPQSAIDSGVTADGALTVTGDDAANYAERVAALMTDRATLMAHQRSNREHALTQDWRKRAQAFVRQLEGVL